MCLRKWPVGVQVASLSCVIYSFMYIVYALHDLPGDHRAVYGDVPPTPLISFMFERPHVAVIWIKSASELLGLCRLCSVIYFFDVKETIIISSTHSPTTLGVWVLICVVVLWDCVLLVSPLVASVPLLCRERQGNFLRSMQTRY